MSLDIPNFSRPVSSNGYAWWYSDGISDDGQFGFTVIAFVGSVFSPYYKLARRRQDADPLRHCAVNVALYGPNINRWAMTERTSNALERTETSYTLEKSKLSWDGESLVIDIDEISAPIPRRIKGQVTLKTNFVQANAYKLDSEGKHHWHPIGPSCRVSAEFTHPKLRWQGDGYFDMNFGLIPLEESFERWDWCRSLEKNDGSTIYYVVDALDRNGAQLCLQINNDGEVEQKPLPPKTVLNKTSLWRVERNTFSSGVAQVLETLEDTPFYARSLVSHEGSNGQAQNFVHESLSLTRFKQPIVQMMLPFRMPRRRR